MELTFFDPTLFYFIGFMVFIGFLVRQIIIRRKSQDEDVWHLTPEETNREKSKLRKNNTGSVITDIQIPFERVLAITFHFFIAVLIITIPIWIIFMIAFSF